MSLRESFQHNRKRLREMEAASLRVLMQGRERLAEIAMACRSTALQGVFYARLNLERAERRAEKVLDVRKAPQRRRELEQARRDLRDARWAAKLAVTACRLIWRREPVTLGGPVPWVDIHDLKVEPAVFLGRAGSYVMIAVGRRLEQTRVVCVEELGRPVPEVDVPRGIPYGTWRRTR